MTTKSIVRRGSDERGVTIILMALMMVAIFLMVAIVIDLGALRQDRQNDRSAADSAVSTAAISLGTAGDQLTACNAAWSSSARSLGASPIPASPCSAVFMGVSCNPGIPRTATGSVGTSQVSITMPVPNNSSLLDAETPGGNRAQGFDAAHDGTDPCERVGVRIVYNRTPFFAQLAGIGSWSTDIHAVARFSVVPRPGGDIPALVALDPSGCSVIDVKGKIIVSPPLGSLGPGILRTDTTNNGCANTASGAVVAVQSGSAGLIQVDGGSGPGQGNIINVATSNAFWTGASSGPTYGYYANRVTAIAPVTRNAVDLIYRCSTSTPAPGRPACPNGQTDVFNTTIQPLLGPGAPSLPALKVLDGTSAGGSPLNNCSNPPLIMTGNWWVNCPTFNQTAAFLGAGTVVFEGGIDVQNLTFNCAVLVCGTDKLVVVRGNTSDSRLLIQSTGATLFAPRTTVYQATGNLYMRGGPTITWTAPTASPTRSLLYWNESTSTMDLGGNPTILSLGVIFSPRSLTKISGNSLIDARQVQFWTNRVEVASGASTFLLRPDPSTAIPTTGAVSILIR